MRLTSFWGLGGAPFLFYPPSPPSRAVVEITKHKETEATDFRFSILIFGEQIRPVPLITQEPSPVTASFADLFFSICLAADGNACGVGGNRRGTMRFF